MPEVAEVAVTAQILNELLAFKTLDCFRFTAGRYERQVPTDYFSFIEHLPMMVTNVCSKGKFMWFELTNKANLSWYVWNTFGLTGKWSTKEVSYTKAVLTFGHLKIYFSDMRNFGTFTFNDSTSKLNTKLNTLGPDFLKNEHFNLDKVSKYNLPIVKLLMDQKKIGSGLGNYLVAEILYRAAISPYRTGTSLTTDELVKLTYFIKYVVKLAYARNCTGYMRYLRSMPTVTKINYHPTIHLGNDCFQFLVYRKKLDPNGNEVIGSKIVGSKNAYRTTYWVPNVQH